MDNSKNTLITVGIVALLVGGVFGFSLGKQMTEKDLKPLVDVAFPPPPAELFGFAGSITKIEGNIISLEINDPDDYLPTNNPKKQIRRVVVGPETNIAIIDFITLDEEGRPLQTEITLEELAIGDVITVVANENIKNSEEFGVTDVLVSREP